jgi:hypothetical protein
MSLVAELLLRHLKGTEKSLDVDNGKLGQKVGSYSA